MNIIKFAASGPDAFELVAAIVIIALTGVALFFLYRNLVHEMREIRKNKKAISDEDEMLEDSGDDVSKLLTDVDEPKVKNILSFIEYAVKKTPEGKLGVLYYVNIDNFKTAVADIYDEKTIDKVIQEIEKKLGKYCSKEALFGHLEEDTFLYYCKDTVDTEHISSIGDELLELFREPLKSIEDNLTASIGAAVYPYDGINAKQLLKNAELATYVSKKESKNSFKMFSEDLIQSEKFNIDYYQEIKKSIKNDEFILYYQAIIDIKTGRIIGLESLLRWNHPKMGILPPSRFINVMELTGDIVWFGAWGFEKTVAQFKFWTQKYRVRDMFISTNLSPKQLEVSGLPEQFFKITEKYGLSPERFCLEIIDYYGILKNQAAMQNIAKFRKYGFRIAIDDVGPDFAIIQDMKDIIPGIFKITRAFVTQLYENGEDINQIKTVIKNAKENSKIVIAEGLENESMIQAIYDNDVRFMQGYFFNHPQSVDEIEVVLNDPPWDMSTFNHITNKKEL